MVYELKEYGYRFDGPNAREKRDYVKRLLRQAEKGSFKAKQILAYSFGIEGDEDITNGHNENR